MRALRFLYIGLLVLVWLGIAQADVVPNMNTTLVNVVDRSSKALKHAFHKAYSQVLIKISGNPSVMTLPAIQNEAANVNQYIQSYSYRNNTAPGEPPLTVQVTFDFKALSQLLQNAGQAVWRSDRPLTLVWVNVNNNVLATHADAAMIDPIKEQSEARGVPVILPAMDSEDQNFVASPELSAEDMSTIAKRYQVRSILVGSVNQRVGSWQGHWQMILNNEPVQWVTQGETAQDVVGKAMDQMADVMANRLAASKTKNLQKKMTVEILGIGDLSEYAKVMQTMQHLSPVASVSVKDMLSDSLLLNVVTVGNAQDLINSLHGNPHFSQIPASLTPGTNQADLYLRWTEAGGDTVTNASATAPVATETSPVAAAVTADKSTQNTPNVNLEADIAAEESQGSHPDAATQELPQ